MYIEKCTNNGTSYLRLVESYRAPNSKGVKVAKNKLILNIFDYFFTKSVFNFPLNVKSDTMFFTSPQREHCIGYGAL